MASKKDDVPRRSTFMVGRRSRHVLRGFCHPSTWALILCSSCVGVWIDISHLAVFGTEARRTGHVESVVLSGMGLCYFFARHSSRFLARLVLGTRTPHSTTESETN